MQLTYRYRLKDKHASELDRQARAVNVVWNYCNETQQKAARDGRKWLSYVDLAGLTAGAGKELDIHAHTVQRVCRRYFESRRQHKRAWLRFRGCKSLGWVPFNTGHVQFVGGAFIFRGERYDVWLDRIPPEGAGIGAGSFSRDGRGRWYINCPVEAAEAMQAPLKYVGIDLGLKDLATLSTGEKIGAPKFYRESEARIATSQRARKTKRARAIHVKIANRRKDFIHKATSKIAEEYGLVVVGDVSPSKLAKTRMAKSVLDAGWADFKRMLLYKSIANGGSALEVSEAFSSQVCSGCGSLPPSRPRGIADLGMREWACGDCGAVHDRDVNAARNILRAGLRTLVEGASTCRPGNPGLQGGE